MSVGAVFNACVNGIHSTSFLPRALPANTTLALTFIDTAISYSELNRSDDWLIDW